MRIVLDPSENDWSHQATHHDPHMKRRLTGQRWNPVSTQAHMRLGNNTENFKTQRNPRLNLTFLPFSVYDKNFLKKFQMKFTLSAATWLHRLVNWYWFGASMCSTSGCATAGIGVIFVHSSGADWGAADACFVGFNGLKQQMSQRLTPFKIKELWREYIDWLLIL